MSKTTTRIPHAAVATTELTPAPIPPEDVVSGNPEGSWALLWHSDDYTHYNGIWRCTPGVFYLTHPGETITCLEGSATITPDGGEPVVVRAGDLAFLPEGMRAKWEVQETVLKTFHSHDSTGTLIADL